MRLIPNTSASGIRCLVENISNESYDLFGVQINGGQQADLFISVPGLTEEQVYDSMTTASGELYIETSISNRLRIVDVDFDNISSPNAIYGHDNRIVFLRSRQDVIETVRRIHLPLADSSRIGIGQGSGPSTVVKGRLIGLAFTLDTDVGYKNILIPENYDSAASIHINWTKSTDNNENGKEVLWRVHYVVYDQDGGDATGQDQYIDFSDTYEDSGTTNRIVHKTQPGFLDGISANKYMALQIEALTPSGTPLNEPVLVSLDFEGNFKINKGYPIIL